MGVFRIKLVLLRSWVEWNIGVFVWGSICEIVERIGDFKKIYCFLRVGVKYFVVGLKKME